MSEFEEHRWSCERVEARTRGTWWWEVSRDGVPVGRLASSNRGTLDSESHFDVFTVDGRPIPDPASFGLTTYDEALRLLHREVSAR